MFGKKKRIKNKSLQKIRFLFPVKNNTRALDVQLLLTHWAKWTKHEINARRWCIPNELKRNKTSKLIKRLNWNKVSIKTKISRILWLIRQGCCLQTAWEITYEKAGKLPWEHPRNATGRTEQRWTSPRPRVSASQKPGENELVWSH